MADLQNEIPGSRPVPNDGQDQRAVAEDEINLSQDKESKIIKGLSITSEYFKVKVDSYEFPYPTDAPEYDW